MAPSCGYAINREDTIAEKFGYYPRDKQNRRPVKEKFIVDRIIGPFLDKNLPGQPDLEGEELKAFHKRQHWFMEWAWLIDTALIIILSSFVYYKMFRSRR